MRSQNHVPRSEYFLSTKCGRIAADEFDYSPDWIRRSIRRSLERLGTDYLDVVFCHDVEFVRPQEVLVAVQTLRELRDLGLIRFVGISGYPLEVLADLARRIKDETGEPLDAVMSYAHYTLQNTNLYTQALSGLRDAEVECVLNGSPIGMGLLRTQGVPIGDLGDFHPAPKALRKRCQDSSRLFEAFGVDNERLETLAIRFSIDGWSKDGATVGTMVKPLSGSDGSLRAVNTGRPRLGVSVAGVSYLEELEELLEIWRDVIRGHEREFLYGRVRDVLGDDWLGYSWPSPGEDYATRQVRPSRQIQLVEGGQSRL